MFTRALYKTPDVIEQHRILEQIAHWVDAGRLRTTLSERLGPINAENLRKAHARIETGSTIGKIALEGW